MVASLDIRLDDGTLGPALRRLMAILNDPRDLLDEIGGALAESTRHRFEVGVGPSGAPWVPSHRARDEGGQTLIDTARLRNSITHRVAGDVVTVGTNVLYAGPHQFGAIIRAKTARGLRFRIGRRSGRAGWANRPSVTLPARPFLGLDADDRAEIATIVDGILTEAVA